LPRLLLAPLQFAQWTLRARFNAGEAHLNPLCEPSERMRHRAR
jgi:hypothetical protein